MALVEDQVSNLASGWIQIKSQKGLKESSRAALGPSRLSTYAEVREISIEKTMKMVAFAESKSQFVHEKLSSLCDQGKRILIEYEMPTVIALNFLTIWQLSLLLKRFKWGAESDQVSDSMQHEFISILPRIEDMLQLRIATALNWEFLCHQCEMNIMPVQLIKSLLEPYISGLVNQKDLFIFGLLPSDKAVTVESYTETIDKILRMESSNTEEERGEQ
ncbi:hypothetical protein PSTEL_13200 [Paenibacillus stellifer]|uniref:Uncharacterized protein n=1 Tax=Paenibacillus stellifer TaxID=169760 RepID=A0A089LSQ6_9BACL|nr:hypothetical protein PSTEL_13200 [Paenibacillus stellifer]